MLQNFKKKKKPLNNVLTFIIAYFTVFHDLTIQEMYKKRVCGMLLSLNVCNLKEYTTSILDNYKLA